MKLILPILAILFPISSYAVSIEEKCIEYTDRSFIIMKNYVEGHISKEEAIRKANSLNIYNFNGKDNNLILKKKEFSAFLDMLKEKTLDTSSDKRKIIYFMTHHYLFRTCMSRLK